MTLGEISRKLKKLDNDKSDLYNMENRLSSYASEKASPVATQGYSFEKVRSNIDAIDKESRRLRHIRAQFNCNTLLPDSKMTVDEALCRLPQLTQELRVLESMKNKTDGQPSRFDNKMSVFLGYSIEDAVAMYDKLYEEQSKIQIALNLINASYNVCDEYGNDIVL